MEYPCVIVKNLCDTYNLRVTDDDDIIASAQILDYLHYTAYRQSDPTVLVFTITPPSSDNVASNAAVIDCETSDERCRVQVSVNGSGAVDTYGIVRGANLFSWAENAQTTSIVVTLTPSRPLAIRCFFTGKKWSLDDPFASDFDPEAILCDQDVINGEAGHVSAVYLHGLKKSLRASWSDVQGQTFLAMEQLRDFTHQLRLPFFFFFRPASYPTRGYMYRLNGAEFHTPQSAGQKYAFSIDASAYFDYDEPGEVSVPEEDPKDLLFTEINNPTGSVTLSWGPNGSYPDGYLVVRRITEYEDEEPDDNAVYVVGDMIGEAGEIVYLGTGMSFVDTPGVGEWYYRFYPFNRSADRSTFRVGSPMEDTVTIV